MRIAPIALSILLLGASACSRDAEPLQPAKTPEQIAHPAPVMASSDAVANATAHPAWLREHLPAASIGYVRIPALWAMAGAPRGRASDAMYAATTQVEAFRQVREALMRDPLLASLGEAPLKLLMAQASPVEVAVLGIGNQASPGSNVVASVRLDTADSAAAAAMLGSVIDMPELSFDAEGFASLQDSGAPVFLHFAPQTQRLTVLGGMFGSLDALRAVLAETATPNPAHPMRALEQHIDSEGHGLLLWLDVPAIRPLLADTLPPEHAWLKPALEQGKALALGFGSANGKGRIALRVEFERSPWADHVPSGPFNHNVSVVGRPDWVITAALPTAGHVSKLFDTLASQEEDGTGPETSFAEVDAELVKLTGLNLEGWMAPFGRELLVVSDEAGPPYNAVRLADAQALQTLLDTLSRLSGKTVSTHDYKGKTIRHLVLPTVPGLQSAMEEDLSDMADTKVKQLMSLYLRIGSHVYWYEDEGWLIMASLPQPLMARIDGAAKRQPLDQWLDKAQGSKRQHALLSVSTELEEVSHTAYHMQLSLLQALADLGNTPLDLFQLPTAQQLGLPRHTGLGAELVMNERQLVLEMNYEHSPLEVLFGSNATASVAVAGVLAAVAIPAYQDYTLRSEVATAVAETGYARQALTEYYQQHGQMPDSDAPLSIELSRTLSSGKGEITVENGAIFLYFNNTTGPLDNMHLYIVPELDDAGTLHWSCGNAFYDTPYDPLTEPEDLPMTDIPEKLLPSHCR